MINERAAEGRFSGADFAGDLNEADALPDAVSHVGERLFMLRTEEKERRIARYGEGLLLEGIEGLVHNVAHSTTISPKWKGGYPKEAFFIPT